MKESKAMHILHRHRYDSESNATEGDNYLLVENLQKGIEIAKKIACEFVEIEIPELNDFDFDSDTDYLEAFLYTNAYGESDYSIQYGSKKYKSDNYIIKVQEIETYQDCKQFWQN